MKDTKNVGVSSAVEVELVVPKFDNSGNPISPEYQTKILKEFSEKVNNGLSVIPTIYGCWENDNGEVQCEENFMIMSAIKKDGNLGEKINNLHDLASEIGKELGQGQMLIIEDEDEEIYEVNGKYESTSPMALKKIRINLLPKFIR